MFFSTIISSSPYKFLFSIITLYFISFSVSFFSIIFYIIGFLISVYISILPSGYGESISIVNKYQKYFPSLSVNVNACINYPPIFGVNSIIYSYSSSYFIYISFLYLLSYISQSTINLLLFFMGFFIFNIISVFSLAFVFIFILFSDNGSSVSPFIMYSKLSFVY